jgi:hypothetical protein
MILTIAAILVLSIRAACIQQNRVIAADSFPVSINWNATRQEFQIVQPQVVVGSE